MEDPGSQTEPGALARREQSEEFDAATRRETYWPAKSGPARIHFEDLDSPGDALSPSFVSSTLSGFSPSKTLIADCRSFVCSVSIMFHPDG